MNELLNELINVFIFLCLYMTATHSCKNINRNCIFSVQLTAVDDSDRLSNIISDIPFDPASQTLVDLLRLLRRRCLPRTDRPHRLVGNDDASPVLIPDVFLDRRQLPVADFVRRARLLFGQLLADAHDRVQAGRQRVGHLLAGQLVALAEEGPPLRMTDEDPAAAEVLDHHRTDLAGVRAVLNAETVLRGDANSLVQPVSDVLEVAERRTDDDLRLRICSAGVEEQYDVVDARPRPVHLPISADEKLPFTHIVVNKPGSGNVYRRMNTRKYLW